MDYGRQVLTHPLLVEAAQDLFVPACVYNNTKDDADAKVLKSFGERAWNNPVVRFLDAERKDVVPKVAGDWSLARLTGAMVAALEAAGRDVPAYLRSLADEEAARKRGVERAAFAMTWYWVGDVRLGVMDGIVSVTPGWIGTLEVVEVEFDPSRIAFEALIAKADACDCALKVFSRTDAQQKLAQAAVGKRAVRSDEKVRVEDDKYYLARTALKYVPMTSLQAARVNARVRAGKEPAALLSPRQRALAKLFEARRTELEAQGLRSAVGVSFREAWTHALARSTPRKPEGSR